MKTVFIFCIFFLVAGCSKPSRELDEARAILNSKPVAIAWAEGDMEKSGLDERLALLVLQDMDRDGPFARLIRFNRGKKASELSGKESRCHAQMASEADNLEQCIFDNGYDKNAKYGTCFGYTKFNVGDSGNSSYIVTSNQKCEDYPFYGQSRQFYIVIPDSRGNYHIDYKAEAGGIAVRKSAGNEVVVTEEVSTVNIELRTIAVFDKVKQKFVPKTCLFRDNNQFREKFGDTYPDDNRLEGAEVVPCTQS